MTNCPNDDLVVDNDFNCNCTGFFINLPHCDGKYIHGHLVSCSHVMYECVSIGVCGYLLSGVR